MRCPPFAPLAGVGFFLVRSVLVCRRPRHAWASALAVVAALAAPAPARAESGSPDAAAYSLDLHYSPRPAQLRGTETIAFTNTGAAQMTTVWLRLWPNAYGGCRRPRIVVDHVVGGSAGALAVDCTALPILLDASLAPGQSGSVSLSFVDTIAHGASRFGLVKRTALLGTAIPVLAVTDSRGLHLEADAPLGESMYSLAAAWDVTLTIPAGLDAATTGTATATSTLPDSSTQLSISAPRARDFAMVIGAFTVHSTVVAGTEIRYFEPAHPTVDAGTVLGWAADAFASYSATYGTYGGAELDIVGLRRLLGDGMEYPEMVMTELVRDTVSHEVAHQWFYGMIGDNQAVEPWLDESFTEFLSERLWGENLDCSVAAPFAGFGNLPLDAPMSVFEANIGNRYYNMLYSGGPCVLEKLRRDWGDALFDAFLADYVATHRYGVTTTTEFKAAVRGWAPANYDVDAFFAYARLTTWPG